MPSLHTSKPTYVRHCLLFGFEGNLINHEEEFVLLCNLNTSKNSDFPYWDYDLFNLDEICNDKSKAERSTTSTQ